MLLWIVATLAHAQSNGPVPSGSPLVRVPDGRMLASDIARIVLRGVKPPVA